MRALSIRVGFATVVQVASIIAALALPFKLRILTQASSVVFPLFFCGIFILAIIALTVEEFRWHRKARYAEASEKVHNALHALRDAFWNVEEGESEHSIRLALRTSLSAIASAFSLISGVHCRACVKIILIDDLNAGQARPYVETLARDNDDPNPAMRHPRDFVDANTDFWLLMKRPELRCFVCNNLRREPGYTNSHWPEKVDGNTTLRYNSTIVWPIRKLIEQPGNPEAELLGFLCVDSVSTGAFWERYDFSIGAGLADALYCFIRRWRDRAGSIQSLVKKKGGTR